MPKHAIKIPALRDGRRVRWMFEVSADVGEGVVHAQKPGKKPTRSKRTIKGTRKGTSQKSSLMDADARRRARPSAPILAPVPPLPSRTTGREMFLAVIIGVVFVAGTTMALVGYPSVRIDSDVRNTPTAGSARPDVLAQPIQDVTPVQATTPVRVAMADHEVAAPARPPKTVVEKSRPTPIAASRSFAPVSPTAAKATPIATPPVPNSVGPEQTANASPTGSPAGATSQTVTISGCLEMAVDEDQFRLTDTEGADAPKARSWKSGFLKKGSTPVDLLDFSDAPMLRKYVGHRVVASGLLSGRQLRVRSVQAGGGSCG